MRRSAVCVRCLEEFVIDGPKTNIEVLHQIMYHPGFIRAAYNTSFIDENLDTMLAWVDAADDAAATEMKEA